MEEIAKVSVVMCTYNGEKFLEEQIDSIVNQTYPVYELIIQDDNSIDNTWDILKTYEEKYSFIKVFRNEKAKGINKNFISAIQRAKGEYIAVSDQDDIWDSHKIEHQINSIENKMLSSGFSRPFSDKGIKIHFDRRIPNYDLERVVYLSSLAGHTMLFRKDFMDVVPDVDKWASFLLYDHLFQIIAAAYDSISFCDEILVYQRRHISAATYGIPFSYDKTFSGIMNYLSRTYSLYRKLRPFMRDHFLQIYELLSSLPEEAIAKEEARKMALYQSQKSFFSFLKLQYICVRLRNKIFYAKEKNQVLALLRAIYFPISCSEYFRYKLD